MVNNTSETKAAENVLSKHPLQDNVDNPFSDELARVFQWITFSFLCQAVALFGVGSNIINIICFVKQGFKDPVNVSFLGLAVADLCCLLTIIWTNLCFNPAFIAADLPFEPVEFQHLVSAMPHFAFIRVSSWITALITAERCLCIIAPIKVKSIVTPKRVTTIIICVFVFLLASNCPLYVVNRLGMKFYPYTNKTLIGMVSSENRDKVEGVSYIINNVCVPFGAFTIIIICTTILVVQLREKTKWRKSATLSSDSDNISTRNTKVAKMVVTISLLFIFCFIPMCVIFIAMSLVPSISMVGKHKNVVFIFGGFGALLESVNSAVNIFIYYDMSTNYKTVLRRLFSCNDFK